MRHDSSTTRADSSPDSYLPALDGLRFVAAYIVFVSHFSNETNLFEKLLGAGGGQIGVMLFFLLSGFLLGHLYLSSPFTGANINRYLLNRLARVAPLFYVIVLASFALTVLGHPEVLYRIDASSIARHAFLIKGDSVLWTIPVEMQFYAVFICIWCGYRKSKAIAVAIMAALIFAMLFAYPVIAKAPWPLLKHIHFFLGGVLIALASFPIRTLLAIDPQKRMLVDAGFLMALLLMILSYPQIHRRLFGVELMAAGWGEVKVFVVCSLVLITAVHSRFAEMVLGGKAGALAGALSYSIYLLHMPIFMSVKSVLGADNLLLLFVASNIAVFVAAGLTAAIIEVPARRRIRRWAAQGRVLPRFGRAQEL